MRKHVELIYKDKMLRGYLDFCTNEQCVIVVHGIGGNKLGNKFIFKQFSDKANEANLSTLRMDFLGTGESDGKFEETDHSDQSDQLNEIINYASKVLGFKKVHLAGTSIGCLVILNTIKNFNPSISSISLWNPNIDLQSYIKEYNDDGQIIDMRGIYLLPTYIDKLKQIDIECDFSKQNIAIMHGVKDYNFENKYVHNFISKNKCDYFQIEDGCHLFESNIAREQLFKDTINYINSAS